MPLAPGRRSRAMFHSTRTRCLLLALTLVWLVGCALPNAKKGATRDPFSQGEKFSCGELCPKGSTH